MHIFSGMEAEIVIFLKSLCLGALMLLLYDFLRVIRRVFIHGLVWMSIEDFLFWIVFAGCFFLGVCVENDGILRFYMLVGMSVGALLCDRFVGRYFVKYIILFVNRVKKRLKKRKEMTTMRLKDRKKERNADGS